MICPKCNSILFFITRSGSKRARCADCGFVGSYAVPAYGGYINEKYENKNQRNVNNDPLLGKVIKQLKFKKDDVVLDYGCGAGDYTKAIGFYCKEACGVDLDTSLAAKRYPSVKFYTINNSKYCDRLYDKIIAVNVIEHVVNYEHLLEKLYRLLKPGGKLFITTYNKNFFLHKKNFDPTHVIEWSKDDFEKFVSKKFIIEKVFLWGTFFNYYPLNMFLVWFLKPELCILARKK